MKSKIQFDLDDDNHPVIKATIIHSDDVRDKIASRFHDSFGGTSNWCHFSWLHGEPGGGSVVQIIPIGYTKEELIKLRDSVNERILEEFPKEKSQS